MVKLKNKPDFQAYVLAKPYPLFLLSVPVITMAAGPERANDQQIY